MYVARREYLRNLIEHVAFCEMGVFGFWAKTFDHSVAFFFSLHYFFLLILRNNRSFISLPPLISCTMNIEAR